MDYSIDINKPNVSGEVFGTLVSDRLVAPVFKQGRIALYFINGNSNSTKEELLDEFVLASVQAFINMQDSIEVMLSGALKNDRLVWKARSSKPDAPEDVWKEAKVESLDLRKRRTTSSKQYLLLLKTKGQDFAAKYCPVDAADIKSTFRLSFRCRWDREHLVRVEFENGELKRVDHS